MRPDNSAITTAAAQVAKVTFEVCAFNALNPTTTIPNANTANWNPKTVIVQHLILGH